MPELMKGHKYSDRKHTVKFPCIAEVKYDEIRVHVKYHADWPQPASGPNVEMGVVEFLSYAGKPLYNLELYSHIFLKFFRESGLTELDMGVEVNGNFNDSYRWVRSKNGYPQEKYDKASGKTFQALNSGMVQWFLFDLPESPQPYVGELRDLGALGTLTPISRTHDILRAKQHLSKLGLNVNIPKSRMVHDTAGLEHYFQQMREAGYEGLMVKSLSHTYEKGKRVDGWLKMKPEEEADGVIARVNQAHAEDGTPHNRAGSIDVVLEDGSVASPAGLEHGLAADMWAHPEKYLGRWIQFKYMERDRAGGYRHPSFVRFREDKV